ncbi:MAG TPA: S41 family peptidase [Thermoanaerobaculia bacterium]|nr:S41 family peptidase [Thermoanaerobaculia bacterium]
MTRIRLLFLLVSAALVLPILTGTLLGAAEREQPPREDSFYKYLSVFSEVLSLVRQAYVEQSDVETLMAGALDGTTDALDPFSLYVPAPHVESFLEAREVGRHHSGLELLKERGVAYVVAAEKGSPAHAAGVKAGDIVAEIQGRSTRLMPLWEVQELLAGSPGTRIELDVIRLGEPRQVAFELRRFDNPPAAIERVEGTAMLRVPAFDGETAGQVRAALAPLGGDKHLLVDLRGVGGGDPEAAYAVGQLFARGELGALLQKGERVSGFTGGEAPLWQGKIVVLVDRGTLGPAEILASVLRQKAGAELVGEPTFGHAGRQATAELSTRGRLLFTDAFYAGPDGAAIDDSLQPDLRVDERSRTFIEKDAPLEELILQRGLRRLRGEDAEAKAAA